MGKFFAPIIGKVVSLLGGGYGKDILEEEFIEYLRQVNRISASPLSKEGKRARYGEELGKLSESAYGQYFMRIMSIVQKSKEDCELYQDSEKQVNNIIGWLPRLEDKRDLVLLVIQERRKKYGLKV